MLHSSLQEYDWSCDNPGARSDMKTVVSNQTIDSKDAAADDQVKTQSFAVQHHDDGRQALCLISYKKAISLLVISDKNLGSDVSRF